MLKRNIPVLVEEIRVATERTSCVRRNSGSESGVSPCHLHAPTRAPAVVCFQRPTLVQNFVAVWPLPWATTSRRGSRMLGTGVGAMMKNCPTGSKPLVLPCAHTSVAIENPLTCSRRCAWTQWTRGAHPKWSCRRSLSIAVELASSIAVCTDLRAWERSNHARLGDGGTCDARSSRSVRSRGWMKVRGPPVQNHPVRPAVFDPGPSRGELPTRFLPFSQAVFQTQYRAGHTWCGQTLIWVELATFAHVK